jgi:hypothetical protein
VIDNSDLFDTETELWVPITPGGTVLTQLCSKTKQGAIDNLLADAAHMPYDGWDSPEGYGFKQRGYEICRTTPSEAKDS